MLSRGLGTQVGSGRGLGEVMSSGWDLLGCGYRWRWAEQVGRAQDGVGLLIQTEGTLRAGWVCGVRDCMQPGKGGGCREVA